jgi:hypothetical protein
MERVLPKTRLATDLGLAGEEADEFFEKFVREFDVDPSSFKGIDLAREFGHEGDPLCIGLPVGIGIIGFCLIYWITGFYVLSIALLLPVAVWVALTLHRRQARPHKDETTVEDLIRTVQAAKKVRGTNGTAG